jgi:hypothetical protein
VRAPRPGFERTVERSRIETEVFMRVAVRVLSVVCVALLALLPARAEAAASLTVTPPAKVQLPADGKTVQPISVELRDDKGAPLDGKRVSATPTGDVELLQTEVLTLGGQATFFVRAKGKPGTSKVAVEGEQQKAEVAIEIVDAAGLDFTTLVGRLGAFFLLMLMLSLVAEKAVDILKLPLSVWAWGKLRPKPRLATYLAKDESLGTLGEDRSKAIFWLMIRKSPGALAVDGQRARIADEDDRRAVVESLWTWVSRIAAAGLGIALACLLDIDLLALLRPIGVHASPTTGHFLTGVGASAGAAFWQDMLDKMTEGKKKITPAG